MSGAAGFSGLVNNSTSGQTLLPIDPKLGRIRKLRSSVTWAARLFVHEFPKLRALMVTLTYRPGVEWEARHISDALKRCREWHKKKSLEMRYTWVAELQKRGALHYHICFWLPANISMPMFDKQRWWPHGWSNVIRARNPIGYLVKYISKCDSAHEFPRGARIYGGGGFKGTAKQIRRWLAQPGYVRSFVGIAASVVRSKGGEVVDRETGVRLL